MKKEARTVLVGVCLLIMLGIVMIYSSSGVYAHDKYGDSFYFIKKHLFFLVVGIMVALYCMSVPAGRLRAYSKWILLFFIFLLLIVLVPGVGIQAGGARRWIRFFGSGLQPSEFAKLGLIIYLADFCARKRYVMESVRYGLIPPLLVTGFVGGLVLIEPDMGTFVALIFVGMVILFVAGANMKHISYLVYAMLPVMVMAVLLKPYRMSRILTVLHPEREAQGAGFQLMQSFISLGTGGLFGVGLGESKQKLYYLPESHTDFIFSIIGEELGFVGAALILLVFVVVIWSLWRMATKMNEKFSALVVTGIAAMISFEVIVNVGVSTGVLPTKGLPLPFISYGGSSLVLHLAAIGLVLNMSRKAG